MQLINGDKFKFFPVKFGDVVVTLGDIKAIRDRSDSPEKQQVEIRTYSGDEFYPRISLEQALSIWKQAFADCEY